MKQVKVFVLTVLFIGVAALPQVKPCVNVRCLERDGRTCLVLVCEPVGKLPVDYTRGLPMDGFRMIFNATIGK